MDNFTFCSPTEFIFGKDSENDTGKYVKKHGGSRVLLHYGGGSALRSGLIGRIKASLEKENIFCKELGGVKPNPRDTLVYEGIDICRKENIDFILAVGGGSVIDSAKAVAAGTLYDGDFWDFYERKRTIEKVLPIGTVLTIAASGSEGSPSSVITRESTMLKRSISSELIRPVFSVLDPALTCTLPPYQTACGAADIMAHVYERYITDTREVEITDRLCEAVLMTVIKEAPRLMREPRNYEARANIMWAGTLAHSNILGVGRTQDWNSHGIEHELSGLYDCAHGAGLAVIMPAWMEFVMSHSVMRFAQAAVRVWGCEMDFECPENTAREGIARFRGFLHGLGLPVNLRELGAREEDIPLLVKNQFTAAKKRTGFVTLSPEDITEIYHIAAGASV